MAKKKNSKEEIKTSELEELKNQLGEEKRNLTDLRVSIRMKKEKNVNLLREKRKEIARILTQTKNLEIISSQENDDSLKPKDKRKDEPSTVEQTKNQED